MMVTFAKIIVKSKTVYYFHKRAPWQVLNRIQDGLFQDCSRMGEHISYNDETWHSYTLPKEDPKNV